MVVDSTALPEQAVRDILASAFQSAASAARRCESSTSKGRGAKDAGNAEGALAMLRIGDPWLISTDVGP